MLHSDDHNYSTKREAPGAPSQFYDKFVKPETALYSDKNRLGVLVLLFAGLTASLVITAACGAYDISPADVFGVIAEQLFPGRTGFEPSTLHNTIVRDIRLPRILLAMFTGAALGSAGAAFQGTFRNPLVEPYILGASAGAAFGAGLGIVCPGFFLSTQLSAFVFSSAAVLAAYALARVNGETPVTTLVLAGVIVGSVFMALVGVMKYLADDTALREIVFWMMGGFYYAGWGDVMIAGPVVAACFFGVWSMGRQLNVLSLGDEEARALGLAPERLKIMLILMATLMTAVSVAAAGIIAWVGLMAPHAVRMLLGPDHRFVIPASAMLGGIYVVWCDTLARTLTSTEIPVGILTALLGAPYLFYLLRSKGASVHGG